ncbi:MAG: NAD-dependent epimerase/dehydratase family protein [Dehalococcoidia bacterium]|nr:NAD-dependent epimerase/dehydratase family protein [Dehalococcoidia bacterium]
MSSKRFRQFRVAVTGATGYVGSRLTLALSRFDEVESVLALDTRQLPSLPPKARMLLCDVGSRDALERAFAEYQPDVVVHLAYRMNPGYDREAARRINVGGTANLLQACGRAKVRLIVYLSSTSVYGAHPDNPKLLTEKQPPRPVRGFAYSEDKLASERLFGEYASQHPDTIVTVLRGCVVMGPHANNFIANALTKPVMVGVLGCDPPMQFLHEDDLVELLIRLIHEPQPGIYNVGGEGTVRYSRVVRASGRPLVRLPALVLYPVIQLLWLLRAQRDSPACGLDLVRWPWVASAEKLKAETGFKPRYTSQQALEAFLAARRTRS